MSKRNRRKDETAELISEIKEEIKGNVEALKSIDGIEEKDLYNEKVKNIKDLNQVMKDLKDDQKGLDKNMLINTCIVAGTSLFQCIMCWKEEPFKALTSPAMRFLIRPKTKF